MMADSGRAGLAPVTLCAAVIAVLLAACGGAAPVAPPIATHQASASAGLTAPAAAAAPQPCAGLTGATARWLPMADGGRLEANTAGSGPAAVVFLHEIGRTGMCGFAPYAAWLIQHYQVQVVLVNRCGYGASDCRSGADTTDIRAETEPAVAWARGNGARTVTLVGASGGGGDALEAAALVPGVTAVVDLSGDVNDTSVDDNVLAPRVTVPALLAPFVCGGAACVQGTSTMACPGLGCPPPPADGGVACGAMVCPGAEMCCTDCSGNKSCQPGCPGFNCPVEASVEASGEAATDAPADAPSQG